MKISFTGAIAGIVFLYIFVTNLYVPNQRIADITTDFAGRTVNISGTVSGLYIHRNGHMFFNLDDGTGKIKVVLWDTVIEEMRMKGINVSDIRNGVNLQVTGDVKLYRGQLEIIPRASGVKFV